LTEITAVIVNSVTSTRLTTKIIPLRLITFPPLWTLRSPDSKHPEAVGEFYLI
jgi:hypothetical protein